MATGKQEHIKQTKLNLLESFLNSSSDVYVLYDKNLCMLDINKAGIKLTGKNKKNIIGKHITKIFKGVEKEPRYKKYLTVLKTGKAVVFEGKLGYKPESDDYFTIHAFKLNEGLGIIARDISKKKSIEKQLFAHQEKLELILGSLPGITYFSTIDKAGKLLVEYMSPKTKELLGLEHKEYLKQVKSGSILKRFHPEDLKEIIRLNKKLKKERKPIRMIYRFMKPGEKNYIWIEEYIIPKRMGDKTGIFGISRNVTEDIKEKEAIKENERKYKNLFERNLAGVFRTNIKTGEIIDCNHSFAQIFGYSKRTELIGKNAKDLFYFSKKERVNYIGDLRKNGSLKNYKLRHKTKYGNEVWILANVNIVTDSAYPNIELIEGTLIDITTLVDLERKTAKAKAIEESNKALTTEIQKRIQTERELLRSQQYTQSIINSSLDMICASDNNDRIIEFNKAAQHIFGYSENEIIGKPSFILYANKLDREKVRKSLSKSGMFSGEVVNKRKNGETFIAFLSGSLLYNEHGEKIGAMGVSRDITELKIAESLLTQSLERNNAIINALPDVILRIDKKGFVLDMLTSTGKFFSLSRNEVCGKNLQDLAPFCVDNQSKRCIKEALNGKSDIIHEYSVLTKDDVFNYFESRYAKINANEVLVVVRDITETKLAQDSIKKSLQEKEILLKEIHHRVKNNLQVISSILNLQSSFIQDAKTQHILRESQNRIKSMAYIHETLYQNKDFSNVNFSAYVANLSKNLFYSYNISQQEVKLVLDIEPVQLSLDNAIPCGLIINELLANALKYAFPNNRRGILTVRVMKENEFINIEIEDNGVGFPDGLDFRCTETLGLQLVMTLAEQINAEIRLISKEGCKFAIKFIPIPPKITK